MEDDKSEEDRSRQLVTSAKKLYGAIQDLSVQLDSLSSRCVDVEELFAPELQTKRLAIKDCCEKLFNLSPKSYGAVAREKLWRVALYDAVNKARKIQRDRPWTPMQLGLVKAHLQGGIGVLQLYIMKLKGLCESTTDPVVVRMDNINKWLEESQPVTENVIIHGDQKRTWITDLAHLCTINIGDLYRYMKEMHSKAKDPDLMFEASFYLAGAQSHYSQAFLLRPDSGLAFNQLGNLYCDVNDTLQSAYYLLQSVQSSSAYEGAYSNLRQLLDRKIVQFARLPASVEPKPIDTLINSVLSLMYYFLYEQTHLANYERHCQEALTNFNERLRTADPAMDDKFMFHLSSICVMTVWRLQAINSVHTSAAVAFSISIFCQLINHLSTILEQHASLVKQVLSVSEPASPSPVPSDVDDKACDDPKTRTTKTDDDDEDKSKTTKEDVFMVPKRRKRVRRGRGEDMNSDSEYSDYERPLNNCSDDEELEITDESDEDSWSDDEDDYDDSIPDDEFDEISQPGESECSFKLEKDPKPFDSSSSNGNSDSSGSSRRENKYTVKEHESQALSDNGIAELLGSNTENTRFVIEVEDLEKCKSQIEAVLVALSPFLRWIQATSVIKDALAANAEKAFLEKLCSTLNLLLSQNWPTVLDGTSLPELANDWNLLCEGSVNEKMVFKWELEEDRSMLGIPQLQEFVNHLRIAPATAVDALVIRIGRMVSFGSWMVSTESFSVLYTPEEMKFVVPTPQTLKAYLLDTKLKRLKDRIKDGKHDDIDKLSRAYNDMKLRSVEKKRSNGGRRRLRHRRDNSEHEGRPNRRDRVANRDRKFGELPHRKGAIYTVVDLEAVLKKFRDVKRIAAHKKFIVVIPCSVWKTLDMMKDSDDVDSPEARVSFQWLEAAFNRRHPGLALFAEKQKHKINFPYPRDPVDVDAWEYFDMMEHCNYLTTTHLKKEGRIRDRSTKVVWGDVRDKCRVFFLTGHDDLLNTKIPRSFDPVKIARNVGIYVDYIEPYPGLGRNHKWKHVANSNG